MSAEQDPRTGRPNSGTVTVAAADGTPNTVLQVRDDALFRIERITVEYSEDATTADDVAIYDEEDGTAVADLDRDLTTLRDVSSGDTIEREGPFRDVENDVVVQTAGDHDAQMEVTVQGTVLTDLRDVSL